MVFLIAFLFLSNQESLYMIHHDKELFDDIYNIKTEHNQRRTHYLSLMFPTQFNIYDEVIEKVLL